MADINHTISLGIGSPAAIPEFITFGLQIGEAAAEVTFTYGVTSLLTNTKGVQSAVTNTKGVQSAATSTKGFDSTLT